MLDELTEKHLNNDNVYLHDNLASMLAISDIDSCKSVSCRIIIQNYKSLRKVLTKGNKTGLPMTRAVQ